MHSRGPNHRLSGSAFRSQVSVLMLAMLTPWHGFTSSAANDTLKIIACREQHKKLAALEMELAASQQEDFASKNLLENKGTPPKKRLLAVVGIITKFGHKNNRDAICKGMDANWMALAMAYNTMLPLEGTS
eukprot:XP_019077571.1 PREDICTED: hydroxyproline O-galactosyltransferase HPGT1 isoform X2 [Vitis vinifera]